MKWLEDYPGHTRFAEINKEKKSLKSFLSIKVLGEGGKYINKLIKRL